MLRDHPPPHRNLIFSSTSLDFLDIVRAFAIYNASPPPYAKNRLFSQEIAITLDVPVDDFYPYVLAHARRYGFHSLKHRGIHAALDCVYNDDHFGGPFMSALIAFPVTMSNSNSSHNSDNSRGYRSGEGGGKGEGDEVLGYDCENYISNHRLVLSCYILWVNVNQSFPTLIKERLPREHLEVTLKQHLDWTDVMLFSDAYVSTLPDVTYCKRSAQIRIETLLMHAKKDYYFDALWKSLASPQASSLSVQDLEDMMTHGRHTSLSLLDPGLLQLFQRRLPWQQLLKQLVSETPLMVRVYKKSNDRLLCVFIDDRYAQDALVLLQIDLSTNTVEAYELVERRCIEEDEATDVHHRRQRECVSTAINRLLEAIFWNCRRWAGGIR
jgi:hypothetical protein